MRINVYSQELICDFDSVDGPVVELDRKRSNTGTIYSVVRLFLHSSDRLHRPPEEDDDRSAVNFWLPRSPERREALATSFEALAKLVRQAPDETGMD